MEDKISIHCFVTGLVQGVFYRATTLEQGKKLGLSGWVRNVSDGRVEVFACGPRAQVLSLYEWMKKGPPRARVEEVSFEELPWEDHKGFEIRC